jgi:hypothetical protein
MKRRTIIILLCLIPLLCQVVFLVACDQVESVSSYEYIIKENTVEISEVSGTNIDLVIPADIEGIPVTSIAPEAFQSVQLNSVIIGKNIAVIPDNAFQGARIYTISFETGSLCTSIGKEAFYRVAGLNRIVLPEGILTIGDRAFYDCASLNAITIPDSVISIGTRAFANATNLMSVTIGENSALTQIGSGAFQGTSKLTTIYFPRNLTQIGEKAFFDTDALTAFAVDPNNSVWSSLDGVLLNKEQTILLKYPRKKAGTEYVIPQSVTLIGDDAFHGNRCLTNVILHDQVTTIGKYAFANALLLNTITISNTSTLETIDSWAFSDCPTLTTIYVPSQVTTMGIQIFQNCPKLSAIQVSASEQPATWTAEWFTGKSEIVIWDYQIPAEPQSEETK